MQCNHPQSHHYHIMIRIFILNIFTFQDSSRCFLNKRNVRQGFVLHTRSHLDCCGTLSTMAMTAIRKQDNHHHPFLFIVIIVTILSTTDITTTTISSADSAPCNSRRLPWTSYQLCALLRHQSSYHWALIMTMTQGK